jgi:hypothetical protein
MPLEGYTKLELGAGGYPSTGGFIHNDIRELPHIELVCDCRDLPMIEPATVTIIRAIHLLEHFDPLDALLALQEWHRKLCHGGVLELAMPNIQRLAILYTDHIITLQAFLRDLWGLPDHPPEVSDPAPIRELCAGAGRPFIQALNDLYALTAHMPEPNCHHWAYSPQTLEKTLSLAGFEHIVVLEEGTSIHAWGVKP